MPIALDKIQDAHSLSNHLDSHNAHFRLMIDSENQIEALDEYSKRQKEDETQKNGPWSIMIKLDGGYHRAGLTVGSEELRKTIRMCLDSPHIDLFGFYAHFGRKLPL